MTATHYMLSVTNGTKAANKLQEEIYHDLKVKDRDLVTANQLEALKTAIEQVVELNNKTYSRCKPVQVYWNELDREKDLPYYYLSLNGHTFMYVKIYGVKEVKL